MANFADVSHHQATFNAAQYFAERPVVALKATEGTGFTDPRFTARWGASKGHRRIAYHFARALNNGADEFAHCWAVVKAAGFDPRNDIIALDVEDPDTPSRALANAKEFVKAATSAGLRIGLIYTYPNYAKAHNITANEFEPGWRRLWYAEYNPISDSAVTLPPGWSRDQFYARQYTDKASVAGVGTCDDNRILRDWLSPVSAPTTGGTTVALDPELKSYLDAKFAQVTTGETTILRGDDPDPATGDTHPKNIGAIFDIVSDMRDAVNMMHQHLMDFITSQSAGTPPADPTQTPGMPPA